MAIREQDALDYHEQGRPGKTEVVPTKPCLTARDLSLAYSPGVAIPCLEIEKNPEDAYRFTNKGNLVAVVSNGTAVLGLGDIGALAGKPVMEGKGVLFKRFAHVDVFDIEVDTHDPAEVIRVCELLEPTFGGINLEDIRAPECFEIEEVLRQKLSIPVFHDDQHGTAIISGAALLNALEIVGKKIEDVRVVVSGAGASAIACSRFYELLGVRRENFLLVDTRGVIHKDREAGMNRYKERYAAETSARTLAEALVGADVFLGCSAKGLVSQEMVRSMADRPILFALANPDPEITYEEARAARDDAIIATGRSDYPNQVNNVLGFPFIFRGALDVRATTINEEMKVAAARALAALAKEPVPDHVSAAYGGQHFEFGPDYIIPKPFDTRVLHWEALAVARAACESGVAKKPITDWDAYRGSLEALINRSENVMRLIRATARRAKKRVVFSDGNSPRVVEACRQLVDEKIAEPVLLGSRSKIERLADHFSLDMTAVEVIDPETSAENGNYADELFRLRSRKGVTPQKADRLVRNPLHHAMMMLRKGHADAMVAGADSSYSDTLRVVIPLSELRPHVRRAVGLHVVLVERRVYIIGDTTVNIEPNSMELSEIAVLAAEMARGLRLEPRVAMLSFSNFGDHDHSRARKVRDAVRILHAEHPNLIADGEMHGDVAVLPDFARENFPHSRVKGDANVLICPDLDSGNIALKLIGYMGSGRDVIGPLLFGLEYPSNVVSFNSDVREIVNIASISAFQACRRSGEAI